MTDWVHQLIEDHRGDAPAVIDPDGRLWNYGDLRRRVIEVSGMLASNGVRPGDRVMLICENCADYIAVTMACSRLRAWVMPVNARHTKEELASLSTHAEPRVILKVACGRFEIVQDEGHPEPVSNTPNTQVAALMYTTGTTSAPKGVMLSHSNLTWNAKTSARLRGMRDDDVVLGVLPGTHIFGFASTMLATMGKGACIRFLPRFEPQAVLDALADGVGVMPAVPQMYARLLEHMDKTGATLNAPKLHYISAGGAPLDPDWKARAEAVFGLALNNGYGITEAAPTVAATRPDQPRDDISVGPPVWGVEITIDAPDKDGVGEIMIDGPGIMLGYYKNPDATADALPRPGLLRSGDLGRLDPDGTLWIEGRKKELIIRSGFNVYPPEIEAMLTRHPNVHVAAVVPNRRGGNEDILAFVHGDIGAAALGDWLRDRLVAYKLPQAIFIVDSFPVAPTGKILKHKLVERFADRVAEWEATV